MTHEKFTLNYIQLLQAKILVRTLMPSYKYWVANMWQAWQQSIICYTHWKSITCGRLYISSSTLLHFRKKDNNTYQGTTWQIKFELDNVNQNSTYILRVAIASANLSELQVYLYSKLLIPFQIKIYNVLMNYCCLIYIGSD